MDNEDREALKSAGLIAAAVFLAIIGLGVALGLATRLYLLTAWG